MAQRLKTITAPNGARFTVDERYADRFIGLLNDLESSGYLIDPNQSGGYNPRNIAKTNTPSQHAYGRAVDINWTDNARGSRGSIPEKLAMDLARKHGMTWGGTWKNRDDMHFQVADGAPIPMANRSFMTAAGLKPQAEASPNVAMNAGATGMSPTGAAGISGAIHSATPNPPSPLFKDTAPTPTPAPMMVAGAPTGAASGAFSMSGTNTMGNIGQAAGGFASAMGQQQNAAAQASQQAAADADKEYQARLAQWMQQIRSRRA